MKNEETIFAEASAIESLAARAAYLQEACGADEALRRDVDGLLAAHALAAGFMQSPAPIPDGITVGHSAGSPTAAAEVEPAGATIGPYKLLERIGEGGMGVVYMADQLRPVRRRVALKIIRPGMDSRQVIARFEAERQALALMDHPSIARVLDAGTTDAGRPYFAMELVKGVPITQYCDANHLTPRERLGLFVQVCQAVQHAHTKGVIHRDLKPTNILVTLHDGVPVPKIIDFGIVKATGGAAQQLTEKTLFTNFAQMIGTPLYMSPEQAEFSGLDVDTRSDVYSLGVLLYELLTSTTPFDKQRLAEAALDEVRRILREEEPPRPSTRLGTLLSKTLTAVCANRRMDPGKLGPSMRGELDWIVMKALEKDRTRRYETASGLAADVQRYLDDDAVEACPPSPWYRFRKFARRNKRALGSAAVLAVAALVGVTALAVSTVLVSRANEGLSASVDRERRAADRERREAYFQRITVAHRELSIDNLPAALRALGDCPADLRGWEWYYLARLCNVEPLVIQNNSAVKGVAFSPDGNQLASAGADGALKVWDSRTRKVIRILEKAHADSALSITFHPDGKHLASRGADQKLIVWDWTTGRQVFVRPCDPVRPFGSACTVAFSPDGRELATGCDGTVYVWDWKDGRLLHTFPGHEKNVISVSYSPDGSRLASACTGEGVKFWDVQTEGPPLRTLSAHRDPISALAFSAPGHLFATASLDQSVKLWDETTGELLSTMVHTGPVESVTFSPDGSRVASTGEDKTVRLWDSSTGREVLGLRGHTGRCGCVAFSPGPHDRRLASASTDGTIRIWDANPLRPDEHQEALSFAAPDQIRSVVVNPIGGRIASAGRGALVKVWDAASGQTFTEFDCHMNVIFSLAWDPDGERIAAAGWDGRLHSLQVRDARSGREVFTVRHASENVDTAHFVVAFSPDGRYLVSGESSGVVQVWDARTGEPVGPVGKHKLDVRGVVFSRDGKQLASASSDGEVKLWDGTRLLNATQRPRLPALAARVPGASLNLAFSPDGKRLATGGDGDAVKIWDVQTGELLRTVLGHRGDVYAVTFSPDEEGRWIASGSEDSTVKVWDSRSGELVCNLRGHKALVCTVAFSLDGERLVSGSRDATVKVWDLRQVVGSEAQIAGRP